MANIPRVQGTSHPEHNRVKKTACHLSREIFVFQGKSSSGTRRRSEWLLKTLLCPGGQWCWAGAWPPPHFQAWLCLVCDGDRGDEGRRVTCGVSRRLCPLCHLGSCPVSPSPEHPRFQRGAKPQRFYCRDLYLLRLLWLIFYCVHVKNSSEALWGRSPCVLPKTATASTVWSPQLSAGRSLRPGLHPAGAPGRLRNGVFLRPSRTHCVGRRPQVLASSPQLRLRARPSHSGDFQSGFTTVGKDKGGGVNAERLAGSHVTQAALARRQVPAGARSLPARLRLLFSASVRVPAAPAPRPAPPAHVGRDRDRRA